MVEVEETGDASAKHATTVKVPVEDFHPDTHNVKVLKRDNGIIVRTKPKGDVEEGTEAEIVTDEDHTETVHTLITKDTFVPIKGEVSPKGSSVESKKHVGEVEVTLTPIPEKPESETEEAQMPPEPEPEETREPTEQEPEPETQEPEFPVLDLEERVEAEPTPEEPEEPPAEAPPEPEPEPPAEPTQAPPEPIPEPEPIEPPTEPAEPPAPPPVFDITVEPPVPRQERVEPTQAPPTPEPAPVPEPVPVPAAPPARPFVPAVPRPRRATPEPRPVPTPEPPQAPPALAPPAQAPPATQSAPVAPQTPATPVPIPVPPEQTPEESRPWYRSKVVIKTGVGTLGVILLLIVGILLGVWIFGGEPPQAPQQQPPAAQDGGQALPISGTGTVTLPTTGWSNWIGAKPDERVAYTFSTPVEAIATDQYGNRYSTTEGVVLVGPVSFSGPAGNIVTASWGPPPV
ncbi:MAG: hypothetical protein HYS87_00490 [Candidatus Colwellbacteria bacterium]|nr:hypothetical protein [Candidatus Colwellbacteria bacterium]